MPGCAIHRVVMKPNPLYFRPQEGDITHVASGGKMCKSLETGLPGGSKICDKMTPELLQDKIGLEYVKQYAKASDIGTRLGPK